MPFEPPSPRRPARALIAGAVLSLAAGFAAADPVEPGDALHQLLADKGLLAAPAAAPAASDAVPASPSLLRRVQERASDLVIGAMNFVGVRYRRGGDSADTGFDCSGFTRFVFERGLGLVLPRRADEQAKAPGLVPVGRDDLRPGDLVFFNTLKRTFSHVGIYIGNNRFIHSPRPGQSVRTDDMNFAYWARRFTGARRAEPSATDIAEQPPRVATQPPGRSEPL